MSRAVSNTCTSQPAPHGEVGARDMVVAVCPWCGRKCKGNRGLQSHLRACKKRLGGGPNVSRSTPGASSGGENGLVLAQTPATDCGEDLEGRTSLGPEGSDPQSAMNEMKRVVVNLGPRVSTGDSQSRERRDAGCAQGPATSRSKRRRGSSGGEGSSSGPRRRRRRRGSGGSASKMVPARDFEVSSEATRGSVLMSQKTMIGDVGGEQSSVQSRGEGAGRS